MRGLFLYLDKWYFFAAVKSLCNVYVRTNMVKGRKNNNYRAVNLSFYYKWGGCWHHIFTTNLMKLLSHFFYYIIKMKFCWFENVMLWNLRRLMNAGCEVVFFLLKILEFHVEIQFIKTTMYLCLYLIFTRERDRRRYREKCTKHLSNMIYILKLNLETCTQVYDCVSCGNAIYSYTKKKWFKQ